MKTPDFITFTGADNWTPVAEMSELSVLYPIEWGILFSPKRQGIDPRYPDGNALSRFLWAAETTIRVSAHLCGDHTKSIMDGYDPPTPPERLNLFHRVQINHNSPDLSAIFHWSRRWGRMQCIAQTRDPSAFPANTSIDWLYDASGGRGIAPSAWPAYPGRMVGYAGGIGPDNVLSVIEAIGATGPYWIDMESGVRTDDRFDLGKVRAVCETVYGPRAQIDAGGNR